MSQNDLRLNTKAMETIKCLRRTIGKLADLANMEDAENPNHNNEIWILFNTYKTDLETLSLRYPEASDFVEERKREVMARRRGQTNSEPVEVKDRRGYVDTYYLPKSGKGGNER